jgi:hypothetical protein
VERAFDFGRFENAHPQPGNRTPCACSGSTATSVAFRQRVTTCNDSAAAGATKWLSYHSVQMHETAFVERRRERAPRLANGREAGRVANHPHREVVAVGHQRLANTCPARCRTISTIASMWRSPDRWCDHNPFKGRTSLVRLSRCCKRASARGVPDRAEAWGKSEPYQRDGAAIGPTTG